MAMSVNFLPKRFITYKALQKIVYNMSGFNKYGLLRDDLLDENEDVREALRRLPPNVIDERNYRILRAIQLSIEFKYLPKKEWTKFEDDKLYLTPLVRQVVKERLEREEWNKRC